MADQRPKGDNQKDEDRIRERNPEWDRLQEFVKKIAQVPKEELNEKLAQEKREKKEKRAG